ncbi:hypothetical protein CAAN1_08S04192 [[Candida] anglica]|uniref:Uncharacterized protein n=1 Tax=[Candida] anglica TaxID=148631 RepID=A0ABP0E8Z2_9ASCO
MMNVTRDGYYSSQYLDEEAQRNRDRYYDDEEGSSTYSDVGYDQVSSQNRDGFISAAVGGSRTVSSSTSTPRVLSGKTFREIEDGGESSTEAGGSSTREIVVTEHPDLKAELTPAQLNYLQKNNTHRLPSRGARRYADDGENAAYKQYVQHGNSWVIAGGNPAGYKGYGRHPGDSGYRYESRGPSNYYRTPRYESRSRRYPPSPPGQSPFITSQYNDEVRTESSSEEDSAYEGGFNDHSGYRSMPASPAGRKKWGLWTKPKRPQDDEYYIKQQERYDQSDFKPKLYTHKTFREVFEDEKTEEKETKYSPIEFVFDPPTSETNPQSPTLKGVLKKVRRKDDYNDYDYYDEKKIKESELRAEIEAKADREKRRKRRQRDREREEALKRKAANPKGGFFSFGRNTQTAQPKDKIVEIHSEDESAPVIVEEGQVEKRVVSPKSIKSNKTAKSEATSKKSAVSAETSSTSGPQFHPAWEYVLSWLVYSPPEEPEPTPAPQSTKSIKTLPSTMKKAAVRMVTPESKPTPLPTGSKQVVTLGPAATTRKKYRNLKSNTKQKWNATKNTWQWAQQPASGLFGKEYEPRNIPSDQYSTVSLPKSKSTTGRTVEFDENLQEFVVEVDDFDTTDSEGGSVDQELYYNPETRQLERTPPTSYGSMSIPTVTTTPTKVISNIASAIKNINIMRIIFSPIDAIAEQFPALQSVVLVLELAIFVWILYELSRLVDALCMMVKAICAPMIAIGRFMNRVT